MSDESPRDIEWPTRRWLMWGIVAIAILAAIVWFFTQLGDSVEDPGDSGDIGTDATTPADVEQVEWTIEVSDLGTEPGTVILKGDEPLGVFVEVWQEGFMIARTADGSLFAWNMDADPAVPEPVYEIDQAQGCDELNALLNEWAQTSQEAFGEAQIVVAQSFAQYALNTLAAQSCEASLQP